METQVLQPQTTDDIKWNTLTKALHNNRCILFIGPSLPVYSTGTDKVDFYSLAALHLSKELMDNGFEFDQTLS
ncbi:MAG: hypothetical protein ICV53_10725, partial [Flavisolibacter sp.]|nr:hypothetical protein [Flavisolibacter sp.]